MDILIICLVILFFTFSIFIHEFGHFVAALWRGLHVEKFSIGFGPKIWGFKYKGVEFILSALPLGGYVSLPQMVPENGSPVASDGKKLANISPMDKIITAIAGPLFNFIFAFILSIAVWQIGKPGLAPTDSFQIISIEKNSPEYKAGVRSGDFIKSINNRAFIDYQDLLEKFVTSRRNITLGLIRNGKSFIVDYSPQANNQYEGLNYPFMQFASPVMISLVEKNGIADKAGLENGDLIKEVNGQKIFSLDEFEAEMVKFGNHEVELTYQRNDVIEKTKILAVQQKYYRLGVFLESDSQGLKIIEFVKNNSAGQKQGLEIGDIINKINNKEINQLADLKAELNSLEPLKMTVIRNNTVVEFSIIPREHINYNFNANYHLSYLTTYPTPYAQFKRVISSTYDTIRSLISPDSSIKAKHMSSVIGISKSLFDQIKILGIMSGIGFLILLNISLGILNLLPLPVLDGGHIVLAIVEKIIGRSVSPKVLRPVLTMCAVFLMSFMFYIMYQDILRLLK